MSLGLTNNNPMNLRDFNIPWNGRIGVNKGFTVFDTALNGIRAGAIDLLGDYIKDGKTTTQALLSEFAPKTENPTENYVKYVAQAVGVLPDGHVDLLNRYILFKFVSAIIRFENGSNPYDDKLIYDALDLALTKMNGKTGSR